MIAKKTTFKDTQFTGFDSVAWENTGGINYSDANSYDYYKNAFYFGTFKLTTWHDFTPLKIFDSTNGPDT